VSGFKVGNKVIYRDTFNGGGEFPAVVTGHADCTFGPSVQIRIREPHAPRFWVPPWALALMPEPVSAALRGDQP
jgi:hypothetical protein